MHFMELSKQQSHSFSLFHGLFLNSEHMLTKFMDSFETTEKTHSHISWTFENEDSEHIHTLSLIQTAPRTENVHMDC